MEQNYPKVFGEVVFPELAWKVDSELAKQHGQKLESSLRKGWLKMLALTTYLSLIIFGGQYFHVIDRMDNTGPLPWIVGFGIAIAIFAGGASILLAVLAWILAVIDITSDQIELKRFREGVGNSRNPTVKQLEMLVAMTQKYPSVREWVGFWAPKGVEWTSADCSKLTLLMGEADESDEVERLKQKLIGVGVAE